MKYYRVLNIGESGDADLKSGSIEKMTPKIKLYQLTQSKCK